MSEQPVVPKFGEKVKLGDFDPGYTGGMDKDEAKEAIESLRARLNDLQDMLYADGRFSMLVILQAIDTGGKDGTIKSVFKEVGPLGCSVANFGVPTAEEQLHDYLWRYHAKAPGRGRMVIFNRSYYEGVLVERVHNFAPEETWRARYEQFNKFEKYLSGQGTAIVKFFLHISEDEQRERLQERADNPKKHWKFHMADLEERKHWRDYQEAFGDMVTRCNTEVAPWHVVPSNKKWYRDVVVAKALIDRLEKLDLRYPAGEPGLAGVKVK